MAASVKSRRWDCRRYDDCLTQAAKVNAPKLPCRGCSDFEPAPPLDPVEVKAIAAACRELWAAVLELERRDEQKEREKAARESWRKTKWFFPASRGGTTRPL